MTIGTQHIQHESLRFFLSFVCLFAVILVLGCRLFCLCVVVFFLPNLWHHNQNKSEAIQTVWGKKNYLASLSQILQDKTELTQIIIPIVSDSTRLWVSGLQWHSTAHTVFFSEDCLQRRRLMSLLPQKTQSPQNRKGHWVREEKVVCVFGVVDWPIRNYFLWTVLLSATTKKNLNRA